MMRRFALLLFLLLWPAQALQAIVWDRDLQTKLGYGETANGKLTIQLVDDYSGPVVLLLARESGEKGQYAGLQPRYDGVLKNGQLSLKDDGGQALSLGKLLGPYKLSVSVQSASVTLPGLKASEKATDTKVDPKTH